MRKFAILVLVLIATIGIPTTVIQPTKAQPAYVVGWAEKAPIPAGPTGQASIVAGNDGRIYLFGGYSGSSELTTAEAYNASSNSWTTLAPLPHATRGAAVAKDSSGMIYVISGYLGGYVLFVQAYNPTTNAWTLKANITTGVWMATGATGKDGKIYVFGGENGLGLTQIYNPGTNTWTSGANLPTPRQQLSAVAAPSGQIYVMGGLSGAALATVEMYDPASNTWTTKTSMPEAKNSFGAALGPGGLIYVFGGTTTYGNDESPYFNTVEVYNPAFDAWFTSNTMPTARREFSAAAASNGRIYTIGGANGVYLTTNEEATLFQPDMPPDTAVIDSVTPNPAAQGQSVTLSGHGVDNYGTIVAYKWRSSISGTIGTSASFSISSLPSGIHTIYFSVEDNSGVWSNEASAILVVSVPTLSLSVPVQVTSGGSLTVSGSLNPPLNATITLTYTRPDGTSINRTVTSDSAGSFSDTYSPDASGLWKVRASTPSGTATIQSLTQTFMVEAPPSLIPWFILIAVVVGFVVAVFLTKPKAPKTG